MKLNMENKNVIDNFSDPFLVSKKVSNIEIVRYSENYKNKWDQFIDNAKNGHFIFKRDYMDYHADRFKDFSLMFFNGKKLIALLPANIEAKSIISHGGLTFGGIISDSKMDATKMIEIFKALKEFLKENNIKKFIYKAIPYIFHSSPAQEDLYALFRNNATLIRRDIASCIFKEGKLKFSRLKKRNIKQCKLNGLTVERSFKFKKYMEIKERDLLKKYGIKPVHTGDEISLLANKFPDNIKLFVVKKEDEIIAGAIIYETNDVAHAQYLASNDKGKKLVASDLLFDYLINEYYDDKKYFDFGISTENNGLYLNSGLINYKEKFGARGIVHDFYELRI